MDHILDQKKTEPELKLDRIFQVEPSISEEDIKNVNNYIASGSWITENKVTKELENEIKSYLGREYAVAVPNGTIAIYLSLLSAGITDGMKVAVPNLTMIATINAVLWANAEPILVDVDESLCMSYEKLLEVEEKIDCVLFVPLNGRTGQGEQIQKWCKEKEVIFIEDSAHALGSSYDSNKCGSLGELSILSFTPHKIITMGQGGMILTDDENLYNYLISIKTFNRSKDKSDWHEGFGLNFKITDLQSSLGLSQFKKLDFFIEKKRNTLNYYQENIKSADIKVKTFKDNELPWFFDIELTSEDGKESLKKYLDKSGIETRDFYPALSSQKYLDKYKSDKLEFSENIYNKLLWLPSGNNLKEEQLSYICKAISDYK